ncbi:unnamed protein product [Brassicogethes aeneus]|uniref:ER-bound oxygenase mpaB/mpaB'/Rubber oxygenase catalytic domain-containing protein n=1 Tax=Brassicogethes aeneus TaxID=1431903 RepID=A0A9P0AXL6_BRAAE|nr:unnamed protein product [Brassicogethes aeneus]
MAKSHKKEKADENQNYFSAEKFVNDLLARAEVPCDKGSKSFDEHTQVPPYYNEELYKRGQQFYHKHYFAMFISKLFGLIAVLAIPTINSILRFTKQSSSNMTAYRRYMETIFHMCIWYEDEFKPGTKMWDSINEVRSKHSSASKRACTVGLGNITQKDMALTQFGFIGMALTQKEKIGIFHTKPEEWEALIHVWRVIGYLMGIEDRFNICRESVEETTEICNLLIEKVFLPEIEKRDPNFIEMSMYILEGLWCFNPFISAKVFFDIFYITLFNNNVAEMDTKKEYLKLTPGQKRYMNFVLYVITTLEYKIWRLYHNTVHKTSLWLMHVFPFLAYFVFGRKNAHVSILNNKSA